MSVHGNNLTTKLSHKTKYRDPESKQYLQEILGKYKQWKTENIKLKGPYSKPKASDIDIITERVRLFNDYKDFLDQQHYAEKFDSRSNLHSSVLEEFLEYLFIDMVKEIDVDALIGKAHAFKDIFFLGDSFKDYLALPEIKIELKDHDFVIGISIDADFASKTKSGQVSKDIFDLPVVAIECKTYLDKTMLEGASTSGSQLKNRNPDTLYLVCAEWLKLSNAVNLSKYDVDQIFVLRKQKNTDREFRYADNYTKNPIYSDVVEAMFNMVRKHLTTDWDTSLSTGLARGWLK